ncbi:MAG: hypothetical protein IKN66_11515 [Ruminococcus sp.]|nr:hypothetical protein [Ruminococcus sp.]
MKKLFKKNSKDNRIVKAFKKCANCVCCSCAGKPSAKNNSDLKSGLN